MVVVAGSRSAPPAGRLLAAAVLASFTSFLDGSIVNVALPAVARELGGGVVLQQWVVDGYLLTLSALILLAGAVTDAAGRLKVLRIAVVAFAVTSLACAASPTGVVLVVARLLQGVAGALLVPGSLSLVIAVFEGAAQSRAIGRWTAWTSTASLIGPIAGGVLVGAAGWRSVFVMSILPAAAALLLLGRAQDAPRDAPAARVDAAGAVLAAIGLAGLTAGLIELGGRAGLPSGAAWALVGVGAAALAAFVVRDLRSPHPLVPPALFRARNFSAGNAATLLIYAGLGLATLVPTLFLQQVAGLTALAAALVGLPATLLLILLSGRFGALSGRVGPRRFMAAGPVVAGAGVAVEALAPSASTAVWFVLGGYVLFGLGMSATVAPLTSAVLGAVPPSSSGIGSAVNNAVARVAGLVATACLGLILAGPLGLGPFARAALVAAGLLVAGGVASWVGVRDPARS